MRCWCGYLSGARCRLFAYGPADATAIPKPHHLLPHLNPDWLYISGTGITWVIVEKRQWNGCSSSSSISSSSSSSSSCCCCCLLFLLTAYLAEAALWLAGRARGWPISWREPALVLPSSPWPWLWPGASRLSLSVTKRRSRPASWSSVTSTSCVSSLSSDSTSNTALHNQRTRRHHGTDLQTPYL